MRSITQSIIDLSKQEFLHQPARFEDVYRGARSQKRTRHRDIPKSGKNPFGGMVMMTIPFEHGWGAPQWGLCRIADPPPLPQM